MIKVQNLKSNSSNEAVKNQFVIIDHEKNATYFQSYDSLIAKWQSYILTLGAHWDYSVTTLKYLYNWLDSYAPAMLKQIDKCSGKSKVDKIRNAIATGIIKYDQEMQ